MPEIVKELEEKEKSLKHEILSTFTKEQISVFFLSKNLRSIYQFNDDFIDDWYKQIFKTDESKIASKRTELFLEYARMLLLDFNYENHLKYWIRQKQSGLISEMKAYFEGEGGK